MVAAASMRCCRIDPAASPAALVGAWLIDALSGTAAITVTCSSTDLIIIGITPPELAEPVRANMVCVLGEPRFAGWHILGP
jgi:hypothetical protein